MSGGSQKYRNAGYTIIGSRIIIEAKNITDPRAFSGRTHRHGGMRSKAFNGRAWIERAYTSGPISLE